MTLALPPPGARRAAPRSDPEPRLRRCHVVHALPGRVRIRIARPELLEPAARLAAWLRGQPGVREARVSPRSASVVVLHDPAALAPRELLERLETISPTALEGAGEARAPADDESAPTLRPLLLSLGATALGLTGEALLTPWLLAGASLPIFGRALALVARERRLGVDVLDAAATGVLALQRQYTTAAAMVSLVSLGEHLREHTRQRSLRAIASLYEHDARSAWRVRAGRKERVAVTRLMPDDEIVLYPGEVAPLDGCVCRGEALVDQHLLTGESTPMHKRPGDEVFAGSALTEGRIYVRAQRLGADTRVAEIARLVSSAPVSDTRALNYASEFADRLVPWSLGGAALVAAGGGSAQICASILIADFGTGMRVAGPTTVLAAMAGSARRGVLIKGGRQLEQLANVDAVVFDKTGTLTRGVPELTAVLGYSAHHTQDQLLALAAAVENRLTHPAAQAVVRAALARSLPLARREDVHYTIGQGVRARVADTTVLVGSPRFLAAQGVSIARARPDLRRAERSAQSPLLLAVNGRLAGMLLYRDQLRDDAGAAVRALHARGVREIVLLTGDCRRVAESVAAQLGIPRTIAEASPARKAEVVAELQHQGRTVAVVGDGINDSPALAIADVGITLADATDLAQQTADVLLLRGELLDIARTIDLARSSLAQIRSSWRINCYANGSAVAFSLTGLGGPILTTAISNGAALLTALRAMTPLLRPSSAPPDGV